jgi:hypothetical protein
MRVTSSVVVSSAVGPDLIVVSFAGDRGRAGNRRRRIGQRPHACHRGNKSRTVIRHARDRGSLALAQLATPVAMIEQALR